ncbi:HNH endonuclease [Burkholderia multivorans]|uniref:HNH endonuclease n=1 Tax=Burkholderia multivorans TaxID=87883 RepID=UPI0018DBA6CB|nr:HNH endonuclease [Burkholderia multivorans]
MKNTKFEVTHDGRVFSIHTNWRGRKELTQALNASGYPSVRIFVNGKRKRVTVHSLVAKIYIGPKPGPGYEVRHLDGNKLNPHFSNLEWGTPKQNAEDRERHGRTSRGEKHSLAIRASNQAEATRAYQASKKRGEA